MQRPSEVVEHLREKGKLATFSIVSRLTYPTDGGTRRQMPAHRKHGICVVQTRHLRIVNTAFALCKHGICTMQTRHLHNVNTAFAHRQLFSSGGGIREWVLTIRRRVVGISQPAVTKGAEPCVTHGTRVCQNRHTLVLLLMQGRPTAVVRLPIRRCLFFSDDGGRVVSTVAPILAHPLFEARTCSYAWSAAPATFCHRHVSAAGGAAYPCSSASAYSAISRSAE